MIDSIWNDADGLDFKWIDSTVNSAYLTWHVAVHWCD